MAIDDRTLGALDDHHIEFIAIDFDGRFTIVHLQRSQFVSFGHFQTQWWLLSGRLRPFPFILNAQIPTTSTDLDGLLGYQAIKPPFGRRNRGVGSEFTRPEIYIERHIGASTEFNTPERCIDPCGSGCSVKWIAVRPVSQASEDFVPIAKLNRCDIRRCDPCFTRELQDQAAICGTRNPQAILQLIGSRFRLRS